MAFSTHSVIVAVALVPDQAIFDYISLVRIGAPFLDGHQECIRWCRQYRILTIATVESKLCIVQLIGLPGVTL